MYTITKEFRFEAAHILLGHDGQCARLHGHSYRVAVTLSSPTLIDDPFEPDYAMVLDFGAISGVWKNALEPVLDHYFLAAVKDVKLHGPDTYQVGDIILPRSYVTALPVLRTTAEELSKFIHSVFDQAFPELVSSVQVWETATGSACYGG